MDVIFDIDGTIADNTKRLHHIEGKKKDWDSFYGTVENDDVIGPVVQVLRRFACTYTDRIVLCTGRPERSREGTMKWWNEGNLYRSGIYTKPSALYMRADSDYRPDVVVKRELYQRMLDDGYSPELVFEDRTRCVDMWRELGLTCLQVAEGDY